MTDQQIDERINQQINAGELPGTGIVPTEQFVLEVAPENIIIDEDLRKLRSWTGNSRQELQLPKLAETIYQEGQRELAKAFRVEAGICLYDGHRRREAVQIIRDEWDATWMLQVVVDESMTRDQAIRAAMLADSQHEAFTPRERARNIAFLRKCYDWQGMEGARKIAEFLGVSPATVLQDERLSKAPAELQEKVEAGLLTVTNALEILASTGKLPAEEQAAAQTKVVERAGELAKKEKAEKAEKAAKGGKPKLEREPTREMKAAAKRMQEELKRKREEREAREKAEREAREGGQSEQTDEPVGDGTPGESTQREGQESQADILPEGAEEDGEDGEDIVAPDATPEAAYGVESAIQTATEAQIERRHVQQATAEVLGDSAKTRAWKMVDAVAWFEIWIPGMQDSPAKEFGKRFLERAKGETTDKELSKAWSLLTMTAFNGMSVGTARELSEPKSELAKSTKRKTPQTSAKPVKKPAKKPAAKPATKPAAKPLAKKTPVKSSKSKAKR